MVDQITLKPEVWFIDRNMSHKPAHFVQATTPATDASVEWILSSLTGRFFLESSIDENFIDNTHVSFEDPSEATLYELKWS